MKLIFLHGLPGVGKLTVARELAELTGFKLFHNHLTVDLVESVFEFGSQPFVELREQIWLEVFSRAAAAKLEGLIFTFVFERTVRDGFVGKVRDIMESNDGEVLFVELKCSAQELEKRMTEPSRRGFGKLTSTQLFRELQESGAFVDAEISAEQLLIDTTELTASETAALIVSRLGLSRAGVTNR
jgi:chloramphenicol 3-O-phosphotransferase